MTSVVLDLDGVLCDFERAFCEKFGYKNRHRVKLEERYPEQADIIPFFVQSPKTYENLDIVPIGFEIAKWCREQNFEIHLVSYRPCDAVEITREWLSRNKVPYDYLSVDKTPKRDRIIDINPLFIVDDLLKVVTEISQTGIHSFLVNWPWNYCNKLPEKVHRIQDFWEFSGKVGVFGEKYAK